MEGYGVTDFKFNDLERKDLEDAYLEIVGVAEPEKSDIELMEGIAERTYIYLKTYENEIFNSCMYEIGNKNVSKIHDKSTDILVEDTLYHELKKLKISNIKIKETSYEFGSILDSFNVGDLELIDIEYALVNHIVETMGG